MISCEEGLGKEVLYEGPLYEEVLPDRRLGRRARQLARALTRMRTVTIARLASTWAEQMAF